MKKVLSVMFIALCVIGLMVSCDHDVAEEGNYLVKIEIAGTGTQYDGTYYVKDATDNDGAGYYKFYYDAECTNLVSFVDNDSESQDYNFHINYDRDAFSYGFVINFSLVTTISSVDQAQTQIGWTRNGTTSQHSVPAGVYTVDIAGGAGTMTVTFKQNCVFDCVHS